MKPKYQNYRVCYSSQFMGVKGKEIYELTQHCHCGSCVNRERYTRGAWNCATASTKDISKIDEIHEFLKNWVCGSDSPIKTTYFNF